MYESSFAFILFCMLPTCWSHLQKAAFACYDREIYLMCPSSYRIIVEEALFGFINLTLDGKNINTACGLPRTEACHVFASLYVANLCTGQTQCQFKVLYSHDLPSTILAPCYAEAQLPASHPAMEVLYSCVPHQLIVPIEQTTRLGGDHVGGYLATTDYLRSIDTPQWKTALAEDFCERMRLPHVSSLSVSRDDDDDTASGVGLFLHIRDVGRMFHSPSVSSSRGLTSSTFQCPDAEPCHADLLRIDLNTDSPDRGRETVFRLELCPAGGGGTVPRKGMAPDRFSSTALLMNSPTVRVGPFYNFYSMDVLTNLQLNHSLPGLGSAQHHGWDKGILLEYILIYCPELPDINGSHPITYFFKVDREIGDTVAMATISCPPQFRLLPAILNTSLPPESLPSKQTIHCDSHRKRWSSPIPVACQTIEEIAQAYLAAIPTTQPSTDAPPTSCCTSEEPGVVVPIDHQGNPIVGPVNDSLMPSGSIAVVGAVAGFILCLLILIILLLALRKRFLEFARRKFSDGSLSTRFQNSGTLFNTLSGSLSFGRLPRSLRQRGKWRTPGGMLSQSAMTIRGSGGKLDREANSTWGSRKPSSRHRSKISLPLLPHEQQSPAVDRRRPGARGAGTPGPQRRRPAGPIGDHSSTCSRDDLLQEGGPLQRAANVAGGGRLNGAVSRSPHPWALPSPGAAQYDSSSDRHLLSSTGPDSLLSSGLEGSSYGPVSSTRRQTLLSAETNLTSLSGGEEGGPGVAGVLPELPADGTTEGFGGDSLPWRSVPRHNFLGGSLSSGFRRLSRFFHTVGSSISPSGQSSVGRKMRGGGGSGGSAETGSSQNSVQHQDATLGRSGGLQPLPGSSDRTLNAANGSVGVTSFPRRLSSQDRSAVCLLDPASCHLSHHHQHQRTHRLSSDEFSSSIQRSPFPDMPSSSRSIQLRPDDSSSNQRQPPSDSTTLHSKRTIISAKPLETVVAATPRFLPSDILPPIPDVSLRPKHSEAFNAETYMEPKGGVTAERLTEHAPLAVSDESDTSQQQTWPSESSIDGEGSYDRQLEPPTGLMVCDPPSQPPPSFPESNHEAPTTTTTTTTTRPGEQQQQQQHRSPLPTKDPAAAPVDQGNTWNAADYFTYDESQSQRNRAGADWPRGRSDSKLLYQPCDNNAGVGGGSSSGGDHSEVIRRPRLSQAGDVRTRPISDALMSNHYYDASQLISASQMINRPSSDNRYSIISNDSLYETVADPKFSPRLYVEHLSDLAPIVESNAAAPEGVQKTFEKHIAPPYANLDDL